MSTLTTAELQKLPGTEEYIERRIRLGEAGLCQNCGKRPSSVNWGDSLALTHGGGQQRCQICTYWPQLKHALERTTALPALIFKLTGAWIRQR
jgi:hypothetical protein